MTFLWCNFGFGKCFEASSQYNHWVGCHCWLSYKIHFLLHITIWSRNGLLLLHKIREDNTWFFWFSVSSWGTHLLSFFTFPIYFKRWMTAEWSTLSSWVTSHVVVRGSVWWWLSISHGQLPMAVHSVLLIFKALISFAKLFESPLHYMFISSFWAKCVADDVSCLHCFMTHFELE